MKKDHQYFLKEKMANYDWLQLPGEILDKILSFLLEESQPPPGDPFGNQVLSWILSCKTFHNLWRKRSLPLYTQITSMARSVELFHWAATEMELPLDLTTCALVASTGHTAVFEHAVGILGCPKNDSSVCMMAAESGNLSMLKLARQKWNVPWDETVATCAARNGNLDMLKWIVQDMHAHWTNQVCLVAAKKGHVHILHYIKEVNGPWHPRVCMDQQENIFGHVSHNVM